MIRIIFFSFLAILCGFTFAFIEWKIDETAAIKELREDMIWQKSQEKIYCCGLWS